MAGVFISYRRADSAGWAGRLKDHLEMRFGADLVWQDVDGIPAGTKWRERITRAVEGADAVLVVIGPRWLELGGHRMRDPKDVLRQEVILALRKSPKVIPVLVGGAAMPAPAALPAPVRPLTERQAVALLDADWQRSIQLLIEGLREAVDRSRDRPPLRDLHAQLYAMQAGFFAALERDSRSALALARQALALLDRSLPHYPKDAYLQLFRGYFEKNAAIALREQGDLKGAAAAVSRADRVFQVMRVELESQAASAYNGIGSAAMLQGRYADALAWIDRALALVPDYAEALHDRELALRLLASQPRRHGDGARAAARKRPARRPRRG